MFAFLKNKNKISINKLEVYKKFLCFFFLFFVLLLFGLILKYRNNKSAKGSYELII